MKRLLSLLLAAALLALAGCGKNTPAVSETAPADPSAAAEQAAAPESDPPVPADGQGRELVLAGLGLDGIEDAVSAFNAGGSGCHVTMTDYLEGRDPEGALERFNADLAAGDVPDLFMLDGLDPAPLVKQGLLADLNGYVDADGEIRREDCFPLLWASAQPDGRLLSLFSTFTLSTLSLRPEDAPAEDMTEQVLSDMAREGESMFLYFGTDSQHLPAAQAELLRQFLQVRAGEFLDLAAGTCDFEGGSFLSLMELVGSFPYGDMAQYNYSEDVTAWPARLHASTLFGFSDLAPSIFDPFGPEAVFCGWPSQDGPAVLVTPVARCAMSARTDCPEGCWAFLRTLLLEGDGEYFHVRRSITQARAEALAAEGVFTPEQTEKVLALFDGAVTVRHNGPSLTESIWDIAEQEAQAYYAGDASAAQTAAAIQSRAAIVLAEQG